MNPEISSSADAIAAWFSWAAVSSRKLRWFDFHYIGYHDLFYPALDLPIVAEILRDLVVDGRVNKIYVYVFSAIIVLQALATYLERVNPSWWQAATLAILGS